MIKAYIFMALFPVSLLWLFFYRVSRMKNALLRYGTLPLAMIMILTMSLFVLTYFQDSLGKFALDKATVVEGRGKSAAAPGSVWVIGLPSLNERRRE